MRAEAATYNLSISNVAISPSNNAYVKGVNMGLGFVEHLTQTPTMENAQIETRQVFEPSHPLADSKGMVSYPKIDTAKEMATLISATRAYEANIRAYNSLRAMTLKAFEIGKQV